MGVIKRFKSLSFYRAFIQSSHLLVAQGFIQLLGIASFMVYTHLFPPEDFGLVSLFYSFCSILLSLATLHVHDTVYRYFYEETGDFRKYVFSSLVIVISIFCVISTLIFLFKDWIFGSLIKNFPSSLIYPLLFYAFCSFLSVFAGYILMARRDTKWAAANNILYNYSKFGIGVAFVLLAVHPKTSISRIWGETLAVGILGLFLLFYIIKSSDYKITRQDFRTHRKYAQKLALPFLFMGFSEMILAAFDQWFINNYFGNYETGIYSFGYKIGALLVGVTTAVYQGSSNDYYESMNARSYEKVAVQTRTILKLVVLGAIGLMFFANDIVVIFARREEYYAAIPIVPVVTMGYVFQALYALYARNFIYAKKAEMLTVLMIACGLINVILNYLFLPTYGYQAAAYTTLASYFFLFIAIHVADRKLLPYKSVSLSYNMPAVLICAACFLLSHKLSSWWGWGPFFLKVFIYVGIFLFLFADRVKDVLGRQSSPQ